MRRLADGLGITGLATLLLIFALMNFPVYAQTNVTTDDLRKAYGFDILISDGGIGAGGFYWREITPTIAGFISFSISESKDSQEKEYMTIWGEKFVPGKINRFLVAPLQIGAQYRLFKDQIMDNFRPFISVGIGPSLIYASPYEHSFFKALGYGKAYHTLGGFIGAGAYVGSDPSNLVGVNFRYYFVPYFSGITSMIDAEKTMSGDDLHFRRKKQFGGFFITFTFGSMR
jgi:hypothetical protein